MLRRQRTARSNGSDSSTSAPAVTLDCFFQGVADHSHLLGSFGLVGAVMHPLQSYIGIGITRGHGYTANFHKLMVRGAKLAVELFGDRHVQTLRPRESDR
jgi:hypothetical protein